MAVLRRVIFIALHIAIYSLALFVISENVEGITIGNEDYSDVAINGIVFISGFVLWVGATIIRPIVNLIAFPIVFITLGLFKIVINAAILGLIVLLLPYINVAGISEFITLLILVSIADLAGSTILTLLEK